MSIGQNSASPTYSFSSDRRFWIATFATCSVMLIVWLTIPWQWSPVDDPGQVLAMKALVETNGTPMAIVNRFQELAAGDLSGGVFRPMAWIYPPLMYLLPVQLAHAVRLLMLMLALVSVLYYFRQKGIRGARFFLMLFIMLAASGTLYQSLLLLSLQELGGVLFLCLGLAARNRVGRIALFLVAALFKAPFAWILVGYAVVLWRRGHRKLSLLSALIGLGTLGIGALWSRGGTYTSNYRVDPFDPQLWKSAANIFEPMNVLLLVSLVWWLAVTQGLVRRDSDFWLIAIAFFGYFGQMIPWGFTAYYMGPISFLLGLLLCTLVGEAREISLRMKVLALSVPALIAMWFTYWGVNFVLTINNVMADSSSCLKQTSNAKTILFGDVLYVTSSPEGPIRIEQNTKLQDANWQGTVGTESNSTDIYLDEATTQVIVLESSPLPEGREMTLTCSRPSLELYSLQ